MGIIGKGNGGLSTYAVNLFRKLDRNRFDCTFLSNDPHPYFEKDIKGLGGRLKVIAARSRHPQKHRQDLRRIMKEEHFDVCHIHLSSDSNICPLEEAKRAGIPIVIAHCHSARVEGFLYPKILHRLNKPKLQRMDVERLACSNAAGKFAYGDAPFTVVNNGIVFVDYANQLRNKGMDTVEALILTGKRRLRPILMTALTTIIALSTTVFDTSSGAELTRPMAVTTIGGLAYSTLLTLFLVPALYKIFHRRKKKAVEEPKNLAPNKPVEG